VPLRQEIDFVERYLAIEQIRFRDRLEVAVALAPETLDALVPNMLLQPLVENAIRHGVARAPFSSKISIQSQRLDGKLELRIRDSGPGPHTSDVSGSGVGLRNARERLSRLYGTEHELRLEPGSAGGALVIVRLPFRHDPAATAQEVLHDYRENPHAGRG
jgi:LytS/YehU family sensor histidine kinase